MNGSSAQGAPTYLVLGGDGKEYGPVTLRDVLNWVQQKRIRAQSRLKRSDSGDWTMAGQLPELRDALLQPSTLTAPSNSEVPSADLSDSDPATEAQMRSGASWFYWIAGLSLINSVLALAGSEWGFILGLGITQIFDAIGSQLGAAGKFVAFGMDLITAAVVVVFGVLAARRQTWAFVVGMALYALDGLLFLLAMDFLGIGFHAFALFCLYRGFTACRELNGTAGAHAQPA
jgi:hypothetical protein